MATLELTRSGIKFTDAKQATARRGILKVEGTPFETIERADGQKVLRSGTYTCDMAFCKTSSGKSKQGIRVLGVYGNSVCFHAATYPHELDACIAPGMTRLPDGVGRSEQAMAQIFRSVGGFTPGKTLELEVH